MDLENIISSKERDTFAGTFYLELFILKNTANNLDVSSMVYSYKTDPFIKIIFA